MVGHRSFAQRCVSCSAALAVAFALTACAPGGDGYRAPVFGFLSGYRAASPGAPVLLENVLWWQGLEDPALSHLVTLALAESLSLKIARERVIAARAERRAVPGQATLGSTAYVRGEGTGSDGPEVRGQLDLGLSWMLDPWGMRRDQLRAADARIDAADAEVDAAQLLLLYNIATAHVALRYQQRLVALAERDLASAADTLRLTRTLSAAQEATRLDVARAEARAAEVRATLPGLKAAIAGRINELAVLAGRAPGRLPPDLAHALARSAGQPLADMSPQVGIPADLLRNRPDIRIAERRYYAAVAEVEAAEAALYPTLSLTGLITLTGLGPGLHRPDYYFGPSVVFPTLPTASGRARVALRQSQARQAHEIWKSTVLTAILEVENGLLEYDAVGTSLSSAGQAARLYRETERLTREVLERGEATLSDLIDAQRDVAQADRRLADLLQQQAQGFIEINVRLGAGHKAAVPAASAPAVQAPAVQAQAVSARP